jgi:hypothetical protein
VATSAWVPATSGQADVLRLDLDDAHAPGRGPRVDDPLEHLGDRGLIRLARRRLRPPLLRRDDVLGAIDLEGAGSGIDGIGPPRGRVCSSAPPNPSKAARTARRSTDAAGARAWKNRCMRRDWLERDRLRRTEAVIEVLRRRAELRRAHGQTVPRELRAAIDDYDRRRHPPSHGAR